MSLCPPGIALPSKPAAMLTNTANTMHLPADASGFLLISDTLQSAGGRPEVFAAGDVATSTHHPRPKAGVYAVRQVGRAWNLHTYMPHARWSKHPFMPPHTLQLCCSHEAVASALTSA